MTCRLGAALSRAATARDCAGDSAMPPQAAATWSMRRHAPPGHIAGKRCAQVVRLRAVPDAVDQPQTRNPSSRSRICTSTFPLSRSCWAVLTRKPRRLRPRRGWRQLCRGQGRDPGPGGRVRFGQDDRGHERPGPADTHAGARFCLRGYDVAAEWAAGAGRATR